MRAPGALPCLHAHTAYAKGCCNRHTARRRELRATQFSFRESNLSLEYQPCTVRRPADLQCPPRCVREGRKIKLFVCVTVRA